MKGSGSRGTRSRGGASPLSFIGPRMTCVALCALLGVIFVSTQLLLVQRAPIQSAEDFEERARHFQREQALERQIAELERQLLEERRLHDQVLVGGAGPAQGGSLQVQSLQAQVDELRGKNSVMQQQLASLGQAAAAPPPAPLPPAPRPPPPPPAGFLQAKLAPVNLGPRLTEDALKAAAKNDAIGVVMITYKRTQYLQRAMNSLLRASRDSVRFPIVISQDDYDQKMMQEVESKYVETGVAFHMHHPHQDDAPVVAKRFGGSKTTLGYVRIAQHYGFVMRRMFDDLGFNQIIFVEEDMELAPDFFSYFSAMLPMLRSDPKLFCVSAWNDNGYNTLVEDNAEAYRTEFFPGLGWMLTRSMWEEVRDRWAVAFWDEFMRRGDVRKGRHCIRPEVSRSYTFGQEGTSGGQFYKEHLTKIKLSDTPVDWGSLDLSRLASAQAFDDYLADRLRRATRVRIDQVDSQGSRGEAIRVLYDDKKEYKAFAKRFNLMEDEKEGIRRMAYRGVIPFAWKGNRVYLYTGGWPGGLD